MKYLYSILIIGVAFLALPFVIDYSTAIANRVVLYVNTGSADPQDSKANLGYWKDENPAAIPTAQVAKK